MRVENNPEAIERGFKELDNFLRKVNVGFDIDGTEVFTLELAIEKYNKAYPDNKKTLSDVTRIYQIFHWIKEAENVDNETAWEISSDFWNNEHTLTQALPVSGATLLSNHLFCQDVHPWRITSRPSFTKEWTHKWHHSWMPWVTPEKILVQKGKEKDMHHKVNSIIDKKVAIFFEDNPAHAVEIADETNALVVMVPQNYNINMKEHSGIVLPWRNERNILEKKRPAAFRAYVALARSLGFI